VASDLAPDAAALPFLVADDLTDNQDTMGLFRRGEREVAARLIPVDALRENVSAAVAALRSVFDELTQDAGRMRLREVQVGFEVTATGGVNFIGTAEVGAKGAITLTFGE
jgi:hypothetical protein